MPISCFICTKLFSTQSNLNKHCRVKHHIKDAGNKFKFLCLECKCSFRTGDELIYHLQNKHSIYTEQEEKYFSTIEGFNSWKVDVETKEKCNYVSCGGKNILGSGDEVQYFRCCRSGNEKGTKNVANRKRNLKTQGSAKLKWACISKITLRKHDNTFYVKRIISHYGHSNEIQHLRISKLDRQQLAGKLLEGVSTTKILNNIRDNIGSDLHRVDLVTRQDLENIRRSYNISQQDGVKHSNDAVSVELWVQECKTTQNNPVLMYKPQGQSSENLMNSDFCLIVMNEMQASLLSQFGKNIIAIDSTHGLNNYDFEMTTIMVVDEFNEGFPVAIMFSNRKDTFINEIFFETIRQKVGVVSCKSFMSDLAETFYNAWVKVMGVAQHQLYCSWHVDRAWRNNLCKILNNDKKVLVYQTLKYLQKSTDTSTFLEQLRSALNNMLDDPDTKKFGEYFSSYYAHNYLKWGYCFRKDCGINTNMKLESMHKVIKYFYLNGKQVKRLDKGLHATLKYIRDKVVDRMIKHTKGKQTAQRSENFKRHRVALCSTFLLNWDDNEAYWSLVHEENQYFVKKTDVLQKCCNFGCEYCNICIHQYSCSCPDFFINSVVCKHIHYVALKSSSTLPQQLIKNENNVVDECIQFFNKANPDLRSNRKERVLKEIADLTMLVNSNDMNNLSDNNFQHILSNIHAAKNVIQISSNEKHDFKDVTDISACKNIIPQNRFFSTKKKKQGNNNSSANIFRNPNLNESTDISNLLMGENVPYISKDRNEDHNYV